MSRPTEPRPNYPTSDPDPETPGVAAAAFGQRLSGPARAPSDEVGAIEWRGHTSLADLELRRRNRVLDELDQELDEFFGH